MAVVRLNWVVKSGDLLPKTRQAPVYSSSKVMVNPPIAYELVDHDQYQ
jgi:hypothetical protein